MPEFNIFFNENDLKKIISNILNQGYILIPDLNYKNSNYTNINNEDNFYNYNLKSSLFFLVHKCYNKSPIEMTKILKDGEEKYFIVQRNGGPTIDFYIPNKFKKKDESLINGFIAYYPTYWNTLNKQNSKTPEELRNMYKQIINDIKKGSKRVKTKMKTFWILPGAIEDVKNGRKLSGFPSLEDDI